MQLPPQTGIPAPRAIAASRLASGGVPSPARKAEAKITADRTPTLIADDFFDAGCVIGTPVRDWRALDISALVGRTLINGVEAGRGTARDVMGHPFAALAWLANSLIDRGQYLKRDEFVFTGSVVETLWVNPGDNVDVEVDNLGTATLSFLSR